MSAASDDATAPNGRAPAFRCCSVRVDAHTLDSAVSTLLDQRPVTTGRAVHLCNAYTLSLASRDPSFAASLNAAHLNLPDGMPLIWIGHRLGLSHLNGRVYGPDLMLEVMRRGQSSNARHYLYGSTDQVLKALTKELLQRFPYLQIVGTTSPPFRPLSESEKSTLIGSLGEIRPDFVWVAIGTPKQDAFVDVFSRLVPATFVGVGAAFEFVAGTKRQAPVWVQRMGFEWLFRLVQEPRRLASRYFIHNLRFVAETWRNQPEVVTD